MSDYREILSNSFQQKRRSNPRYSLRAFARDIELSPSRLSEVMAGKGQLSRDKAVIIAKKLKFSPLISEEFFDLIDSVSAPEKHVRDAALDRINLRKKNSQSNAICEEDFKLLTDPKYFIIWSFMCLPQYDGDVERICKSLRMNSLETFEALHRLERIQLARRDGMLWFAVPGKFNIGDSAPSEAIRTYHKNISALGRKSIEQQHKDQRHLDSAVITFDSKRIGEVKQKIANFTHSLINEFADDTQGDSIYGWSSQFFMLGSVDNSNEINKTKIH